MTASRKTVQCTNEDCPEVATKGRPWVGQRRPASRSFEAPCPRCSSAVVVVVTEAAAAALEVEDAAREAPAEPEPPKAPKPARPFMGIPRLDLHVVRVGMAARQRLVLLQREPKHRGKTLEQLAAEVVDAWAAGLLDPRGEA